MEGVGEQCKETDDRSVAVVGIDFSDISRQALVVASNLSRVTRDLDVHLLHVLPPPAMAASETIALIGYEAHGAAARRKLEILTAEVSERGPFRSLIHLRTGDVPREIVQHACDVEADLIVIGTRNHSGIDRLLRRSIAEKVQRLAPCPVLSVRPKAPPDSAYIEPTCPFCRATRIESHGAEIWCEQHDHLARDLPLAPNPEIIVR